MSLENHLKTNFDLEFSELYEFEGLKKIDKKFQEFLREKNPEIFVENVKSMLVGNTFIHFEELNFNLLIKNIINEWALLNNITPIQKLPIFINYFPKVKMIPLGSSFKVTRTLGKESVSIGSGMYRSISPGYSIPQLVR